MDCTQAREAASAWLDGEAGGTAEPAVAEHLHVCSRCRAFVTRIEHQHRRLRIGVASAPVDRTAAILAAIGAHDTARERANALRVVLAAVGVVQLAAAIPVFFSATHDGRHLASFSAALAIGFVMVARQPNRVGGLLPVALVVGAGLAVTAVWDLSRGSAVPWAEVMHLAELIGVGAVVLLSRSVTAQDHPILA